MLALWDLQKSRLVGCVLLMSALALGGCSSQLADMSAADTPAHPKEPGGYLPVHDLPPDKAKEVADLVATTDGIIFHLWSPDDKVPSGRVMIAQSVGHVNLTQAELKKGAQETAAAQASSK